MAKNITLRIRAISQANLDVILSIIEESSKGVKILDVHDTREEPPAK